MHALYLVAVALHCSVSLARTGSLKCTLKKNPPSGLLCGVKGSIPEYQYSPDSGEISLPAKVSSIEDCANFHDYFYTLFWLNQTSNLCYMTYVTDYPDPDNSSDTVFYQRDCFDCKTVCPKPLTGNLLWNGGFEDTHFGPWLYEGAANSRYSIGPGSHSTSSFLQLGYAILSQDNSYYCGGSTRKITWDYKVVATESYNNTHLGLQAEDATFTITNYSAINGTWMSGVAYTPNRVGTNLYNSGDVTFFFGGGYDNKYYIDNVVLQRMPDDIATKQSSQLITNGGFESGNLGPWSVDFSGIGDQNYSIVSPGLDGSNHALQFVTGVSSKGNANLAQKLNTKPNTSYLVSFDWVLVQRQGGVDMTLTYNGDFADASTLFIHFPGTSGTKSGTFSQPIHVTGTRTQLLFSIFFNKKKTGSSNSFTLDNFSVKELVE